jgi:hypothetical protein
MAAMPLGHDDLRVLLCRLGDHLRNEVLRARDGGAALTGIAGATAADTIYEVDRITDDALVAWFDREWPADEPVEVISEGLDAPVVLPRRAGDQGPRWTCIVDPIDGTRGLMYDKRSAWVLAAVAPHRRAEGGSAPGLVDLVAAAMTEVPTVKQTLADQISGVRGRGRAGLVAERIDLGALGDRRASPTRRPLDLRPSTATDLEHGWASFARFFPQGKAMIAAFEERLWAELYSHGERRDVAIFDDQYLCTGGQVHELLAGHDRMIGDVRPLAFAELGWSAALACHPYDCCTAFLLEEAGGVVGRPARRSARHDHARRVDRVCKRRPGGAGAARRLAAGGGVLPIGPLTQGGLVLDGARHAVTAGWRAAEDRSRHRSDGSARTTRRHRRRGRARGRSRARGPSPGCRG